MLRPGTDDSQANRPTKRYRSACDVCHQAKIRCSGGTPCDGCAKLGVHCIYSLSSRVGRPKGVRNKKTIDRINRTNASSEPGPKQHRRSLSQPESSPLVRENGDFAQNIHKSQESLRSSSLNPLNDGSQYWNLFSGGFQAEYETLSLGNSFLDTSQFHARIIPEHGESSLFLPIDSLHHTATSSSPLPTFTYAPSVDNTSDTLSSQTDLDIIAPSTSLPKIDTKHSRNNSRASSNIDSAIASTCNCLSRYAELLCRLKAMHRSNPYQVDVILLGARQAHEAWTGMLHCQTCQNDDELDQDVLLMAVMTIRLVLRSLDNLSYPEDSDMIDSTRYSPSTDHISPERLDAVKSSLGVYEMSLDERAMVTELLASRTLKQIKQVLNCLNNKLEKAKLNRMMNSGLSSRFSLPSHGFDISDDELREGLGTISAVDVDYLQQLLSGVDSTVHFLSQRLRHPNILVQDTVTCNHD